MKTASKFLSMLLLVALCLSLMGGSAYALAPLGDQEMLSSLAPLDSSDVSSDSSASGLATLDDGAIDTYTSSPELNSLDVMPLTAPDNVWNGLYDSLQNAVNGVTAGSTLTLKADTEDNGATINKNLVIDLGGKTLTLAGTITINANVTVRIINGTITTSNSSKIVVVKGGTLNHDNVTIPADVIQSDGTVGTVGTCVATVNGKNFDNVQSALDYAATLTSAVTISFPNDTSKLAALTFDSWPTMQCSSLTLNLNANELDGEILVIKPTTINGSSATVSGRITVQGSSLTVNSGVTVTEVGVGHNNYGGTITINGGTVNSLYLCDATLNMSKGTIGTLVIQDQTRASKLSVGGGTVNTFIVDPDNNIYPQKAIYGGTWGVDDGYKQYFEGSLVDNYYLTGSNPYTVTNNGSGIVNPGNPGNGNSGVDGSYYYNVVGSPYTRNSNGSVYVELSALSSTNYWISTDYSANGASVISSGNYSLINYSNGIYNYRLTFNNSYLNGLSNGTYYLFGQDSNKNTVRMGSFTVQGSNDVIPGTAAVWPVDDTWYSGNGMYYFYVTPSLQLVSGGTYDYYDVKIDGMQIGGDKISYNGYQKFGVASSVMDTLATGTHSITVQTTAGTATGSFRVGATLRAVDTDKHVIGSSKNLQFVCSEAISRVWVGSTEITNNYGDYYTLSNNRKTITLSAGFLNNRTAGQTYTITVQTDGGYTPSCTFQILTTAQASSSPRTGDESNLALWAAVLIISGGAAVAVLPRLKKHED